MLNAQVWAMLIFCSFCFAHECHQHCIGGEGGSKTSEVSFEQGWGGCICSRLARRPGIGGHASHLICFASTGASLRSARSAPGYWRTCLAFWMLCVEGCLARLASLGSLGPRGFRLPPRFARLARRRVWVSAPAWLGSASLGMPCCGASVRARLCPCNL